MVLPPFCWHLIELPWLVNLPKSVPLRFGFLRAVPMTFFLGVIVFWDPCFSLLCCVFGAVFFGYACRHGAQDMVGNRSENINGRSGRRSHAAEPDAHGHRRSLDRSSPIFGHAWPFQHPPADVNRLADFLGADPLVKILCVSSYQPHLWDSRKASEQNYKPSATTIYGKGRRSHPVTTYGENSPDFSSRQVTSDQHLETIHISTTELGSARRGHSVPAARCTSETRDRLRPVPTTVSGLISASYGYVQHWVTCPSTF